MLEWVHFMMHDHCKIEWGVSPRFWIECACFMSLHGNALCVYMFCTGMRSLQLCPLAVGRVRLHDLILEQLNHNRWQGLVALASLFLCSFCSPHGLAQLGDFAHVRFSWRRFETVNTGRNVFECGRTNVPYQQHTCCCLSSCLPCQLGLAQVSHAWCFGCETVSPVNPKHRTRPVFDGVLRRKLSQDDKETAFQCGVQYRLDTFQMID